MVYVILTKKYVVFAYRQYNLYKSLINTKVIGKLFKEYASVDSTVIAEKRGLYFKLQNKTTIISSHIFKTTNLNKLYVFKKMTAIFGEKNVELYMKGVITQEIYNVIADIEMFRRYGNSKKCNAVIFDNVISNWVANKYISNKYEYFNIPDYTIIYYLMLYLINIFKNGIRIPQYKKYISIAKEAVWGFNNEYFRDDILIDGLYFNYKDLLLIKIEDEDGRNKAFNQARKKEYNVFDTTKEKYPITSQSILWIYLIIINSIYVWFISIIKSEKYYLKYILHFYRSIIPYIILLENYKIGLLHSIRDHYVGNIETMIMNYYNTSVFIYHWSDYSIYPYTIRQYISHNIFFIWGELYKDYINYSKDSNDSTNYVISGCPILKNKKDNYNKSVNLKRNIFNNNKKFISFLDTTINSNFFYSEQDVLEYLHNILIFAENNPEYNVLLKHKSSDTSSYLESNNNKIHIKYKELINKLNSLKNFKYIDSDSYFATDIVLMSDIVVMWSIGTLPILSYLSGVHALSYDITKNNTHPLAIQYKDIIVFDDWLKLVQQISNILHNDNYKLQSINKCIINKYDPYADDNAIIRIKKYLHNHLKN